MKNTFFTIIVFAAFLGVGVVSANAQESYKSQAPGKTGQESVQANQPPGTPPWTTLAEPVEPKREEGGGSTPMLMDRPLEIWTFIDNYRIITGKTLHLTVQLIWKLGITINLEEISKINFHPCRIEGVVIGERQIFDNEHDYQVITYTLSMPSEVKDGIYTLPSFTLTYRNEVDKTEGKTSSSPITIKKSPVIIEGKVDRDVINIGDRINYTLTIRHEKNVNLLWENLEKQNFSPFELLKKHIEKRTEGNIERVTISYALSIYELNGKKKTPEIPGLTVLYYQDTPALNAHTRSSMETFDTKEMKTSPIPIIINSLLKAVDVPLEGMKGPVCYSEKSLCLHGYLPMGAGAMLFIFLCVMKLRATSRRFSPLQNQGQETLQTALARLQNTLASFPSAGEDAVADAKHLQEASKALRSYLGVIMGISNETAQSVVTADFLNYDTLMCLPGDALPAIQAALKRLDSLVFGTRIEKESVDKAMQEIQEIIRLTGLPT